MNSLVIHSLFILFLGMVSGCTHHETIQPKSAHPENQEPAVQISGSGTIETTITHSVEVLDLGQNRTPKHSVLTDRWFKLSKIDMATKTAQISMTHDSHETVLTGKHDGSVMSANGEVIRALRISEFSEKGVKLEVSGVGYDIKGLETPIR